MRRPLARPVVPVLLALALLTACGSDPSPVAEPPEETSADPSSSAPATSAPPTGGPPPSAAPIEGLVVEPEDPSHEHKEGPLEYDRLPPVGGPHYPRWLACDVYDEEVPLEMAVHSLEHGAVWFAYDPDLPADEVRTLAELAKKDPEYVLVAPLRGMDSAVVAVTWGVSLEATSADDPRLEEFLDAYAGGGQGGEPGAPCRGSGLTPREARGLLETSA
jgi:hypothetical protein